MKSPLGAVKLPVVIAAALGLGLAASAFLNFQQHQRSEQDKKLLQGEIVDLRYQVQQDKLAAASPTPDLSDIPSDSPSPSASPTPTPSESPAATPAVLGDQAAAPQTRTIKAACNLRAKATENSTRLTRVPAGAVVTLGADASNGYQQVTINGKTGYVLASYLK